MRKLSLMGHSQTRSASPAPFPSPCPPFPFELLPPGLQAQLVKADLPEQAWLYGGCR